jgi:hypothetical protein
MKTIAKMKSGERGSALLIGLMVVAGLSFLGLGFVAISETESAISVNQRNAAQVESVAESGVRAVVEWFQNPQSSASAGIMPLLNEADKNAMKKERFLVGGIFGVGSTGALTSIGRYEQQTNAEFFCCDRPYKPLAVDRLFGSDDAPDIVIDRTTSTTSATVAVEGVNYTGTFLQRFNSVMIPTGSDVRITRIEIYGPPMLSGVRNANNFWQSGDRYGLATIRVTAEKFRSVSDANASIDPTATAPDPVSRRIVRAVISEWPFPGPQGPIQSNANIQTGGSVQVHWGKITAQQTMFIKRALSGLPWFNAHHRLTFEHGYDSAKPWAAVRAYQVGEVVTPTDPLRAGRHDYMCVVAGTSGAIPPTWTEDFATNITDGTVQWRVKNKVQHRTQSLDIRDQENWLYTILGKQVDDPWIEARARGAITNANATPGNPHPFKYTGTAQLEFDESAGQAGLSNWFQLQTTTDTGFPFNLKEVVFPRIDYQFWKELALNGRGTEGVYYLKWVAGENYTDGRQTKNFAQWTDIEAGAQPGFYFFDTRNGQNPQVTGGSAFLTPAVDVNSSDSSNTWTMQGFIYLNSTNFGTQGIRGVGGYYNFPGEPFRDIGFYEVNPSTMRLIRDNPSAVYPTPFNHVIKPGTEGNRTWDYQDLNGNDVFDLKLIQREINASNTPGELPVRTEWVPIPFFDGCTTFGQSGACSEPHEPYINLIYPATACCGGGSEPNPLTIGWQDPANQTRRPKKRRADDTVPPNPCANSADFPLCTSNSYDRDGFLDNWSAAQDAPVLDGVFYNEGAFDPTGNARYFGSLLIKGDVDSNGTNEVWFDERLVKDEWPPRDWPFPRVVITALQTEN